MKNLCTECHTTSEHLVVTIEVRWRQRQETLKVRVPWKWIASTDAIDRIEAELARRGQAREREGRPWLPLETWE